MAGGNLISQEDAFELIGHSNVSFVDGSWYLPSQGRDGKQEFQKMRIPGAVYFDIDEVSDADSTLPHMLPSPEVFAENVSLLGINHENLIIVYDGPGLFSAPRVWWTFKTMGAIDVRILEGGFDGWKKAGLPIETGNPNPPRARMFSPTIVPGNVAAQSDVIAQAKNTETVILDARPYERFIGEAAEPRAGLRSGHIPGSKSLPASRLIEDGKLKKQDELESIFNSLGIGKDTPVTTTCGSGVTAAIIYLALAETGRLNTSLYDGSWAEWGLPDGPEIELDED